jgi:hypothetical protein
VLSTSQLDNTIAWHENRGGQFALPTIDTSQGVILDGQLEDVLRIDLVHRGRAGDSDAEWVTLAILQEETVGDPLSDTEANNLIQSVSVYLDDGSATFDLNLSNIPVSTPLVCDAGTVIRTGTAVVVAAPAGDLTFRAGQSVELRDGFEVETDASFTAEIDPGLQP